ncbi:galactose oxidase-like protein [Chitinophaga polysaccharea]|uniref:Galactose oxidase-like protein n=2 Tax=Chitinophaga polysaccharea TaxID=1293035 RepID=A0A561PQR1_9BACT|nr:galactose oxidase-like protein [Chitinophaga polysaccharea]
MHKYFFIIMALSFLMHENCSNPGAGAPLLPLHWDTLPPIPDPTGFAGSFAGTSNGALIVAGGSNFPNGGTPWNGGKKTWYDHIFILDKPGGKWQLAGKLPRSLGYGVSVSDGKGLICIGGSNADGHYPDVFRLRWQHGEIVTDTLPALPTPLANTCGAMAQNRIYVAGGLHVPADQAAANDFYMLDLSTLDTLPRWQQLPSWPGPARMLAVAGTDGPDFYLFSGTALEHGKRSYLNDAYRYQPDAGWKRVSDLPAPVVAAPTPAWKTGVHQLTIFGGDDGKHADQAAQLREHHPGFSDAILSYNTVSDRWELQGSMATQHNADAPANPNGSYWAPVTTTLVDWNGMLVLPGGEVRPGTRTPHVLTATKILR